ncbi:RDD family protein [Teredinibacter franksiae]|uniref:RDD family protein n=1 Tax=Teredinibacter franksiae TaxID=2761453 RepID=UPI00162321D7|nr:RDD family protein [Teredinibacter franksiae]
MSEFELNLNHGAPLWRRFASMVYDSFLLGALSMGYFAVVTVLSYLTGGDTTGGTNHLMITSEIGQTLSLLGWILTLAGFYIFFWCKAGQTAGMRAWRLQVVRTENTTQAQRPTLRESCIRAPLALLSMLLGGGGYWWCLLDSNSDCLHDKMSKTRVILTEPRKKK